MKVLIATPTTGEIVTTAYVRSVVGATIVLHELGWRYRHAMFDGSDIAYARNYFANFALQDPELTHLLFIDSDMLLDLDVFRRVIAFDKEMVGAIYTTRALDWQKHSDLLRNGESDDRAKALAARFAVRTAPGPVQVVDGFCKVEAIGFGCVLIQRGLLERMSKRCDPFEMHDANLASHFRPPPVRLLLTLAP